MGRSPRSGLKPITLLASPTSPLQHLPPRIRATSPRATNAATRATFPRHAGAGRHPRIPPNLSVLRVPITPHRHKGGKPRARVVECKAPNPAQTTFQGLCPGAQRRARRNARRRRLCANCGRSRGFCAFRKADIAHAATISIRCRAEKRSAFRHLLFPFRSRRRQSQLPFYAIVHWLCRCA